jgi:hypothetical protein
MFPTQEMLLHTLLRISCLLTLVWALPPMRGPVMPSEKAQAACLPSDLESSVSDPILCRRTEKAQTEAFSPVVLSKREQMSGVCPAG